MTVLGIINNTQRTFGGLCIQPQTIEHSLQGMFSQWCIDATGYT